tara:strand:+ start:301 stop:486 length:186 start_codon:yes stop_codon:yes gene_type:complete
MKGIFYIEIETTEGIEVQWYEKLSDWVDMLNEYAINDMGVYGYGIHKVAGVTNMSERVEVR